ncbi:hypothetical protein TSAR_009608, partial [Trichomalopsis sarcophagae]
IFEFIENTLRTNFQVQFKSVAPYSGTQKSHIPQVYSSGNSDPLTRFLQNRTYIDLKRRKETRKNTYEVSLGSAPSTVRNMTRLVNWGFSRSLNTNIGSATLLEVPGAQGWQYQRRILEYLVSRIDSINIVSLDYLKYSTISMLSCSRNP